MEPDLRTEGVSDVRIAPLFDLLVCLAEPLHFGKARGTLRVLYRATGGSFVGERLRGRVVAGGGDWATFTPGGAMQVDVRLTLRTEDDALIHMTYAGRLATPPELRAAMADASTRGGVDPAGYYFRTAPLFETGSAQYGWLNDIVSVGSGRLVDGGVAYRIFEIL